MFFHPTHRVTRELIGSFDRRKVVPEGTEVRVDTESGRPYTDGVYVQFPESEQLFALPKDVLEPISQTRGIQWDE